MSKNDNNKEDRIIDILEKNLIVQLYMNGVTRNEITKILKTSPNKVSGITKYLKKGEQNG